MFILIEGEYEDAKIIGIYDSYEAVGRQIAKAFIQDDPNNLEISGIDKDYNDVNIVGIENIGAHIKERHEIEPSEFIFDDSQTRWFLKDVVINRTFEEQGLVGEDELWEG